MDLNHSSQLRRQGRAFSLIEILVVIGIIGILATITLTVTAGASKKKTLARATAELQQIAAAIENFKAQYNGYPRDNVNDTRVNGLYYELVGVDYVPDDPMTAPNDEAFVTVDKRTTLPPAAIQLIFGNAGFDNARQPGAPSPRSPFVPAPRQIGRLSTNIAIPGSPYTVDLLVVPGKGTNDLKGADGSDLNVWHYQSTSPAHNPKSFDLWADIAIGNEVHRVCNWGRKVEKLR